MLGCVEEAEQYLSELKEEEKVAESVWFMKVSWNAALQSGNNFNEMRRAFQACYKVSYWSSLLSSDIFTRFSYVPSYPMTTQTFLGKRHVS